MGLLALRRAIFALGIGAVAHGCSSSPAPPTCTSAITVDDFKEIVIVDDGVTKDARTRNASNGPWSFRYAVEAMTPVGADAGEFVRQWLLEWGSLTSYNGFQLDRPNEGRARDMTARVLCPWYKRTPANGCNDDCSTCTANPPKLDLAQAPFRLFAIINRMDLRDQPDEGASGEGREEFGLTDGPGDDPASPQMPMALIFEYELPSSRTTKEWAESWHALGKHAAFDEDYRTALEALTNQWVGRNVSTSRQNGSAIRTVRTNESTLDWIWQLRQFGLGSDGQLHLVGARNTPPEQLNGNQALVDYMNANADAVLAEKYEVPAALLAGSADALVYQWSFPKVDPKLSQKFAQNTCNGCHTQQPNVDSAFHISPFRTGVDRLSKFIYDPSNRAGDQLTKRENALRAGMCGP